MISPSAAVIALCTSGTAAGTGGGIGGFFAVGPVDHHAAVAGFGFGHHADDGVGIFFGNFEEGDGGEEVDAADFDLALDVAVDDVDDFAGEEMVALATVDEKSAVTFLCLMWLCSATAFAPAAATALGGGLALRTVGGLDDFGGIGIVTEETSELCGDNAFDKVFAREPRQLAVDLGEEGGNLVVVDLDMLQLVDDVVELLGADFLGVGELCAFEMPSAVFGGEDDAFDGADFGLLTDMYNADARTAFAGAAGASGTVDVAFDVVRETVVDDVCQVVDIEASGGNVGGDEELRTVLAELLHGQVALGLCQVAVEGLGVVAVADEVVGDFLGLHAGAAEDDGIDAGIVVDNALEGGIFVLGLDEIIDVVDMLRPFVARADDNLLVVVEIAFGNPFNLGPHGGGEEEGVAVGRDAGENLVDAFGESHVQHLVGLVEDHILHLVEEGDTAVHKVDETSGSGDNDLCAFAEAADLGLDAGTAIDGDDVHAGKITAVVAEVVADLQTQLAGGRKDNGLRLTVLDVDALKDRKAVGGCLSGAGLGKGNDIVMVAQEIGDDRFLYGHRGFVAQLGNGGQQLLAQTKG